MENAGIYYLEKMKQMDKIAKTTLSIMFIVLCSLMGLALVEEGRQRQIENLEKPMFKQSVFSLGIQNYHRTDPLIQENN